MQDDPFMPLFIAPGHAQARPLAGLTLLLVEDSRVSAEALRLICQRGGARLRRADTIRAARRHLQVYVPSAVLVDIGLPDGSGLDLIAEIAGRGTGLSVLATSGDEGAEPAARAAGAAGFIAKPVGGISGLCAALAAALPEELASPAMREAATLRQVAPARPLADRTALWDDLEAAEQMLPDASHDPARAAYLAQFLGSVARVCGDDALGEAARALKAGPAAPEAARALARLMQDRRAPAAL